MRRRLLMAWRAGLIVLVVEFVMYTLVGYLSLDNHSLVWEKFNEKAYTIADVDSKIPYAQNINRHARQVGINAQVIASLIQAESSFQPRAQSAAGAYGLMQITPGTWRQINQESKVCIGRHPGECNSECYYNEELNINIGTLYLSQLLKKYKGNMVLALAAYNAGPGAVDKYGGIPPYEETITYTKRVIDNWYELSHYPLPSSIFSLTQWENVHKLIGWCFIATILGLLWVVRGLYRLHHSWRWG